MEEKKPVLRDTEHGGVEHTDDKKIVTEHKKNVGSTARKHTPKKSVWKGKKVSPKMKPRRYMLRSSLDGVRGLRSMSKDKAKASSEPINPVVNSRPKKRKKRTEGKTSLNNEFLQTRKRVQYLLRRINYEQSLIEAYSSEGWKGQSADKVRPEKELERAKSNILQCKLRIRDVLRNLDSLLSVGRLEEKLFDEDGQIDSEDMFCAKCGSKDSSIDNDIILCDGNCERGFHQKCLHPPLPTEEIPLEDEGWLCPACDCKVDCLELLNEFQASDLSIEDTWENVFPEAAGVANGNKQFDDLNYPSDDSEDQDYDPDALEGNTNDQEEGYDPDAPEVDDDDQEIGSSSDESDSTSLSVEDLGSTRDTKINDLGLSLDDSDEDDFDPDRPDSDKDALNEESESNESDFTSDSDDFCAELSKSAKANKISSPTITDSMLPEGSSQARDEIRKLPINTKLPFVAEAVAGQESTCPLSRKSQLDSLNYSKLYDFKDPCGKMSSSSSEDEDWPEKAIRKKVKEDANMKESTIPVARSAINQKRLRVKAKVKEEDAKDMENVNQPQVSLETHESAPNSSHENQQHDGNRNQVTSSSRKHFDEKASQKLQKIFAGDAYPSRETKQELAEEMGVTIARISHWFEHARRCWRISAKKYNLLGTSATGSDKEANCSGITTPDRGKKPIVESSRKDTKSSKESYEISPANTCAERRTSIINYCKDQVRHGSHADAKSKDTDDSNRQKAVARELRKRKKK